MNDQVPDYIWLRRLIVKAATEEEAINMIHARDKEIRQQIGRELNIKRLITIAEMSIRISNGLIATARVKDEKEIAEHWANIEEDKKLIEKLKGMME